jgi:hypothetical protein
MFSAAFVHRRGDLPTAFFVFKALRTNIISSCTQAGGNLSPLSDAGSVSASLAAARAREAPGFYVREKENHTKGSFLNAS